MDSSKLKVVYAITERGEKSYWTKIGVAYTNRDNSITIKLDAVPVGGTMQVRDWTPRDEQPAHTDGRPPARRGNGATGPGVPVDELVGPF